MTEKREKELESHSQMLGLIGLTVEDFEDHPEATTLQLVEILRCRYEILFWTCKLNEIMKKLYPDENH
jgi:hypothetical protein